MYILCIHGNLLLTHLLVTNGAGKAVDTPCLVKGTEYCEMTHISYLQFIFCPI